MYPRFEYKTFCSFGTKSEASKYITCPSDCPENGLYLSRVCHCWYFSGSSANMAFAMSASIRCFTSGPAPVSFALRQSSKSASKPFNLPSRRISIFAVSPADLSVMSATPLTTKFHTCAIFSMYGYRVSYTASISKFSPVAVFATCVCVKISALNTARLACSVNLSTYPSIHCRNSTGGVLYRIVRSISGKSPVFAGVTTISSCVVVGRFLYPVP